MFEVGQEVICIDAKGTTYLALDSHDGTVPVPILLDVRRELIEGAHYHISWIGMYKFPPVPGLYCPEMICVSVREFDRDIPFRATRFAPLQKKQAETDISALSKLTKVRELEDA